MNRIYLNENKESVVEQSKRKELMITLAVLLVIVLIVAGVVVTNNSSKELDAVTTNTATEQTELAVDKTPPVGNGSTVTEIPVTSSDNTAEFKDGTYSANGSYSTPGGRENITVSVTISNDTVTTTTAEVSKNSNDSEEYTTSFIENFKALVVGKAIDDIKLSRVSGSSLTSQGFNSAIEKIKTEAKS